VRWVREWGVVEGCFSCDQEVTIGAESASPAERIYVDGLWRVAHAFDSSLRGWLVVVPRRHVTSIADLTGAEAAALGPLLRRVSLALRDVVRCAKTYVIQFGEADGFAHLHFHVVPRMPDLPPEHRGPRVFHYLSRPEAEWLTAGARAEIARSLAARLAGG